jgi:hypothetical protein
MWRWCEMLRICESFCVELCNFLPVPYICKLFSLLLLNFTQHFSSWLDGRIILKPPVSFHNCHKYTEVHPSQLSIDWTVFLAYFTEMKLGFQIISLSVCPTYNFWAYWKILITFGIQLEGNSGNFAYQHLWYVNGSLTCRKILRHGASGFTSIRRNMRCRFLSPLKPIALAGFQPATLESSGKHANHYITEATNKIDAL